MPPPSKQPRSKRKRSTKQPGNDMADDARKKSKREWYKTAQVQAKIVDPSTSSLLPPAPALPSRIESLPTEILHMIASECTFSSIARLSRTSKSLHAVLNDDQKQLWCKLLRSKFDDCDRSPNLADFRRASQIYRLITKGKTCQEPEVYRSWADSRVVVALRLLINRAYTNGPVSANMKTLVLAARKLGLFLNLYKTHPSVGQIADNSTGSYLGHILLTLLHIGFDAWDSLLQPNYRPYEPEFTLAAFHIPRCYPLFVKTRSLQAGPSMQMIPHSTNLLLIANFFRVYLMEDYCSRVHDLYRKLPAHLRPQPWHQQIARAKMLKGTTHWKGCSASMCDVQVARLRTCGPNGLRNAYECAEFDEDALEQRQFFDLRIDVLDGMETCKWHATFEVELGLCHEEKLKHPQPLSNGPFQTRQTEHNSPFVGILQARETEMISGNIHELSETDRISGFKRISFVTAESPFNLSKEELLNAVQRPGFEDEVTWAYEGVVLPGSNMMIGRWWRMGVEPLLPYVEFTGDETILDLPPSPIEMDQSAEWSFWREESEYLRLCTGPFIYWRV